MNVTALRTVRQEPVNECPICGGENGKHQPVRVPCPYPFNLRMFKYVHCPLGRIVTDAQEYAGG